MNPPGLFLSEPLDPLLARLCAKDRDLVDDLACGLHHTNGLLWAAEDGVRGEALDAARVADGKRLIDRLNMDRVRHAERLDQVIAGAYPTPLASAPLHTESLSSVIDRLSVSMLRLHHTELAAAQDPEIRARLDGVKSQLREVHGGLSALVEDLVAGRRRLPHGARHKLYGAARSEEDPTPSPQLPRVLALGGLSECGKSTSGNYLKDEGSTRFKIGYLLDQAAARKGLADPYAVSPHRQAELLLDELNRFADAHVDTDLITIESVHSTESAAALKQMMGERLSVVYVDTPRSLRLTRSGGDEKSLDEKDRVKIGRGADRICADVVVDNSGSVTHLRSGLRRLASPPVDVRFKTVSPEELGLPPAVCAATSQLMDRVAELCKGPYLVALTGSAVCGEWREGWSDLDLLLITEDGDGDPGLRGTVDDYRSALQAYADIHLGATVLSLAEAQARRLPPRVLTALVMLQEGAPALLAGPGLRFPVISRQEVERVASTVLADVMATTRRLRHDPGLGRIRSLYKHLLLVCRLLLMEQAVWVSGNEDVIPTALRMIPDLGPLDLPPMDEVIAAHRWGADRARVLCAIEDAVDSVLGWHQRQCAA